MTTFAERCGVQTPERKRQVADVMRRIADDGIDQVRFSWCDLHGMLRGKTLMAAHAAKALDAGVGMVGTVMLKDSSDHTAYKVFEPDGLADIPGFAGAANLMLLADPASYRVLPWATRTATVLCQPWFQNGQPVTLDTRRILQHALSALAASGYGLRCGLEIEFHIYRIDDTVAPSDPDLAAWPGPAPRVSMIHPGYNLLSEAWTDLAHEPLAIVQRTAQGLGLPLTSLEIELGPSQVEAVFDATDALTAADDMVRFRNGVTQASAPRRIPCQLHVPPAVSEHHVQRLASAPVAGAPGQWPECISRARPANPEQRRSMRSRCCRRSVNTTWPGCWHMPAPWPRSARRRSMATDVSSPMRWRHWRHRGVATTAARCCASSAPRRTAARSRARQRDAHREPAG